MSVLDFDRPLKMEGSLAEIFFQKHSNSFGHAIRNDYQTDSQNNKVFESSKAYNSALTDTDMWLKKSVSERASILLKLSIAIKNSTELFAQIEYLVRGIFARDTKKTVGLIAEYFRYYSDSSKLLFSDKNKNSESRIMLTNTTPLLALAQVAQSFAAGTGVILMVDVNVAALGTLFGELAESAGITMELLSIHPFYGSQLHLHVQKITNNSFFFQTKFYGSTMIVYESSDLDSAADIVSSAAWSNKGLLPWALQRILIQESVYDVFIEKLSNKIENYVYTFPIDYNPDQETKQIISNVDALLERVTDQGIKYIQSRNGIFKNVVLLDNVPPNFWEDLSTEVPTPIVTAQSFRTTKDALAIMAFVNPVGLSIWCNNISVCHEVALAANCDRVWINSFGLIRPDVSIKSQYFTNRFLGGTEGYYCSFKEDDSPIIEYPNIRKLEQQEVSPKVSYEVLAAMKLQASWAASNKQHKILCLIKTAEYFESYKEEWISTQIAEFDIDETEALQILEETVKYLKFAVGVCKNFTNDCVVNSDKSMCLSVREALGVVLINEESNHLHYFAYTVVAAVLFGNAVLCTATTDLITLACKAFSDYGLPVISVSDFNTHNEMVDAFWNVGDDINYGQKQINPNTWLESTIRMASHVKNINELKMRWSNVKNIWSTFGETFAN